MTIDVVILGCGSSAGVPRVAQGWGECDPNNPKNRRRRCAILVEKRGEREPTRLLVDAGADLREQLIATEVHRLDAVLLTHAHADHIHGLDDLRPLTMAMHRKIDVFFDPPTWAAVGSRFDYLFETPPGSNYPPLLIPHVFDYGRSFAHGGPAGEIDVLPFRLNHGDIDAVGFRFGACAYTPDVKYVPPESMEFLENLDLWIVDALRHKHHPSHLSVAETLELIAHFKPKRAVLTNLHTDLDYEVLRRNLPANIEPAYDFMRLSV
ncbi:MBL fold metallo-hydrolase [Rhodoblastus acidophilus]|uniref:MBL fold metallo-hydrolase n=1 Tax=Candidatus Rhodoblastus alkanivorans TaxID=2954117 RepID=A0ABS9Z7C4_9HYPH|nr:MBL fold metallo-hydrolase [Candidatus Rhodoblastus alkanivorans]MCI4678335.1 MBL fold metallo-hydrolase [Candidatus Rhodoblastus alkanivorans]MCI4683593.1 MBL fold metallo-hydrolase [Candidatus Rhodoblastus alkanivorans]MDI4640909.1 MBL fold metallo-hydrolase [Rhodoblastus acidophilus]